RRPQELEGRCRRLRRPARGPRSGCRDGRKANGESRRRPETPLSLAGAEIARRVGAGLLRGFEERRTHCGTPLAPLPSWFADAIFPGAADHSGLILIKEPTMSQRMVRFLPQTLLRRGWARVLALCALAGGLLTLTPTAPLSSPQGGEAAPQTPQRVTGANWRQAYKYSAEFIRQFVYSTSVAANWIGKSDTFWYEYRTSKGKQWYRVNPREATKEPLFDRVKLAAQLSEQARKPLDPLQLPLTRITLSDDAGKLKFVVEQLQFEYDLRGETLAKLGKAPPPGPGGPGGMTPAQLEQMRQVLG